MNEHLFVQAGCTPRLWNLPWGCAASYRALW